MNGGRLKVISLCIGVAFFAALNVHIMAQVPTAQEFSGRATGINSTITTNGTVSTMTAGDTCPLPPRGGTSTVTTPGGPLIVGVLGSGTIVSSTSGSGITSQSSSSVTGFVLNAGGWSFHANNVESSTQCNCCDIASPMCSAMSSVTGLTVTDPNGRQCHRYTKRIKQSGSHIAGRFDHVQRTGHDGNRRPHCERDAYQRHGRRKRL